MTERQVRVFYLVAWLAFVLLFLVTIAGSIVRASGSGMGCPDWPLCFGKLIPPTHESQLPEGYEDSYAVQGRPAVFNAFNTWAEYINRLSGALAGLGLLVQLVLAFRFRKSEPKWLGLAFLILIMTFGEAVLGARVVASFLLPYMVTLHLLLALLILAFQILLLTRIRPVLDPRLGHRRPWTRKLLPIWWLVMIPTAIQIFLGTRIREVHDAGRWGHDITAVNEWIASTFGLYQVHIFSGFFLLAVSILLVLRFYKLGREGQSHRSPGEMQIIPSIWVVVLAALQILLGFVMVQLGIPEALKPLHLILAELMYVFLFWIAWSHLWPGRR